MLTFSAKTWGRRGGRGGQGILILAGVSCAALILISVLSSLWSAPAPTPPLASGGVGENNEHKAADMSQSKQPLSLPLEENAWLVVSIIGGGFDGKGMGVVAANSMGEVAAGATTGPPESHFSCRTGFTDEELRKLARVVSSARGREWAKQYADPKNPDGCCDQFSYLLELHNRQPGGGEQVYAASWYDSSAYLLPKDLTALHEVVTSIKAKAVNGCENGPAAR